MNTRPFPWFLVASALLVAAPGADAATLAAVRSAGVLHIGTEGNYRPFNYYEGKTLTGFEVELGDAIAKAMGLKPRWTTTVFESLLIGLGQDRYDLVIASHGITPEREKAVNFTNPHYCSGGVLVSLPGGPRTKADLRGRVVTVGVNTSYLQYLRALPGLKDVKTLPATNEQLQAVLSRRADSMVLDRFNAIDVAKTMPGKLQLGDVIFPERIGMAVKLGNTELRDAVNAALTRLMNDGTYARLSRTYFGQDVRCR